jgi:hypothetical protein
VAGLTKEHRVVHIRSPCQLYDFVLGGFCKPCQHKTAKHKVAGLHTRARARLNCENCVAGLTKEPRVDHIFSPCPLYDFVLAAFVSPANTKPKIIKWNRFLFLNKK